jgi:hypothetical protein
MTTENKKNIQPPTIVSIDYFPLEERETILDIANHSASVGKTFRHNKIEYSSQKNEDGSISIFLYKNEPNSPQKIITSGFTAEELIQFNQLVQTSKNTEDKVFNFKGENYKVTVEGDKIFTGLVHTSPPIH